MFETVKNFLEKDQIVKPLWLGETSSAYGGGAYGLSDRQDRPLHISNYMYFDI